MTENKSDMTKVEQEQEQEQEEEPKLIIVDKGVEYPLKKVERKKHQRTTKNDIHEFVRWLFKHNNDEAFNKLSNGKLSNMYLSETGIFINRETIRRNRKVWRLIDGKIVNTENEYGNVIKNDEKKNEENK